MDYFYLTNNIDEIKIVDKSNVNWIFLDFEYYGKFTRQGGLNTVQAKKNDLKNIDDYFSNIKNSKVLVRCNPIFKGLEKELEIIIAKNPDRIMLPYFKSNTHVERFVKLLEKYNFKGETALLFETLESLRNIETIIQNFKIDYCHLGLNDLHLERFQKNMFLAYYDGIVDYFMQNCKSQLIPFGIGGIGHPSKYYSPEPIKLMAYLKFHNVNGVILSRSFKNDIFGFGKFDDVYLTSLNNDLEKFLNITKDDYSVDLFLNEGRKLIL